MADLPSDNLARTDGRWAVLAGLRFGLAMVVVAGHLSWFPASSGGAVARAMGGLMAGLMAGLAELGGTSAVLGFLVISGYSIGHSLDRRPAGFYRRRVLRIYPVYAAAVAYAVVPFALRPGPLTGPGLAFAVPRPTAAVVAGNLLLVQNLACPPLGSDPLVWTLGIEVVCYAAAPWLRRWPTPALAGVVGASALAFADYPRSPLSDHGRLHYGSLLYGLPLALFAWAWVAGFLMHRHRARPARWGVGVAVLGAGLLVVNDAYGQPGSVSTFAAAVLVVAAAGRVPVPRWLGPGLNRLGDLSYPLYLFHLPTFLLGYCVLGLRTPTALVAAAVGVSGAVLGVEATARAAVARRVPAVDVPARPAVP